MHTPTYTHTKKKNKRLVGDMLSLGMARVRTQTVQMGFAELHKCHTYF